MLSSWYHVKFDNEKIVRDVHPSSGKAWSDAVLWSKIIRVCFKTAEDFTGSDEIYIFTSEREESYLIPTEAGGGAELWNEILRRELFDAKLAIAMTSSSGRLECWPPEKKEST